MPMFIKEDDCTNCSICEPSCPTESISVVKGVYTVDSSTCNECEGEENGPECINVCPIDDCIERVAA